MVPSAGFNEAAANCCRGSTASVDTDELVHCFNEAAAIDAAEAAWSMNVVGAIRRSFNEAAAN